MRKRKRKVATDLNVCAHESIISNTPELEFAALKNIGVQGVRIGAIWGLVELNKGQFTGYPVNPNSLPAGFEAIDRAVAAARNQGLNVNLLLNTPMPSYATLDWGAPQAAVDYGNFCKQAALRYKDLGVKQFELGNEWNVGAMWDGSWRGGYVASEIAAFIKAGSVAIKAVIPDAIIVSCGMAACLDWPGAWWSRGPSQRLPSGMLLDLLNLGVGPYVDKIGYHPYTMADNFTDIQPPSATHKFIKEVAVIHNVLASKGMGEKKIELTEYGWSTAQVTEATLGGYIKTEWDILHGTAYAPFVSGHYIYCGRDFIYPGQIYSPTNQQQNMGMFHQDLTPKVGITSKVSAL
jgi:hypothetical protein